MGEEICQVGDNYSEANSYSGILIKIDSPEGSIIYIGDEKDNTSQQLSRHLSIPSDVLPQIIGRRANYLVDYDEHGPGGLFGHYNFRLKILDGELEGKVFTGSTSF